MADDAVSWANSKLQGDWSAAAVASHLSQQKLRDLLPVFSKGKMDNMVKVRLLIACLFLSKQERRQMADDLSQLAELAKGDEDEWVRTIGLAVGSDFSGQLDLDAVLHGNHTVHETMAAIWTQLDTAGDGSDAECAAPDCFLPLQVGDGAGIRDWQGGGGEKAMQKGRRPCICGRATLGSHCLQACMRMPC